MHVVDCALFFHEHTDRQQTMQQPGQQERQLVAKIQVLIRRVRPATDQIMQKAKTYVHPSGDIISAEVLSYTSC